MSLLFTPARLGRIDIANRVVMAPMTRSRARDDGLVRPMTTTYYAQRAEAGMIVSEGIFPEARGKGYVRTPGIATETQAEAWRSVTDAVHAEGGKIVAQLMHSGRISHPSLQPDGALPVAPSAIRPKGQAWTAEGQKDFVTPRALDIEEIGGIVQSYRDATRRALDAGFDGVELHGASGYLPEQFLSSGTNERADAYGGSIPNRARFLLETLNAMIDEAGTGRVGLKLSPEMDFNDIRDETPVETYSYIADQIDGRRMAYLHVTTFGKKATDYHALLRSRFDGAYLIGGGLTKETAEALVAGDEATAAVFGSAFLATPDLVERFRVDAPLNEADREALYSSGPEGYTDHPTLTDLKRRRSARA